MPNTITDLMKKLAEQNIDVQRLRTEKSNLEEQIEQLESNIEDLENMEYSNDLHEKQKNEACEWLAENCSVEDLCQLVNLTANVQEKPYPYPGYLGEGIYLPPEMSKSGE